MNVFLSSVEKIRTEGKVAVWIAVGIWLLDAAAVLAQPPTGDDISMSMLFLWAGLGLCAYGRLCNLVADALEKIARPAASASGPSDPVTIDP